MRTLVEKLVRMLGKNSSYSLDAGLSDRDIIAMLGQSLTWALRGLYLRARIGKATGLVLVGHKARIRYPWYLRAGKNLVLEDYVEIVALSKQGITCGDNVTIGAYAMVKPSNYYGGSVGEGLVIGDNSNIGPYSYVGCSGLVTIGRNVIMGPRVSLFAENHRFDDVETAIRDQGVIRDPIVIQDDCWIASGVSILAGVTIGQGAVVASGSIVTHDVPPYSVVAGVPARVLRSRMPG